MGRRTDGQSGSKSAALFISSPGLSEIPFGFVVHFPGSHCAPEGEREGKRTWWKRNRKKRQTKGACEGRRRESAEWRGAEESRGGRMENISSSLSFCLQPPSFLSPWVWDPELMIKRKKPHPLHTPTPVCWRVFAWSDSQ